MYSISIRCVKQRFSVFIGYIPFMITVVKNMPASAGDARDSGSISGSGRSSGGGHGNPL